MADVSTKAKRVARKVHDADRRLSREASRKKDAEPRRSAAIIAELSDQPPLIALSVATLLFGLATRRAKVAEAGGRMLASHLIATALKNVVKRRIDRTRPHSVRKGYGYRLKPGRSTSHHQTSFPSGHTAGAVAVARAAARIWPEATPAFSLAAGSMGALQLPIGKHYASDVAAGAVVGLAGEAVVDAVVRGLRHLSTVRAEPVAAPSLSNPDFISIRRS